MDWTERLEQKKKIEKMACRMLWADFKDMVLGWRGILLVMMYIFYFLVPYNREIDDLNTAAFYYFVMWVLAALTALAETSFNYLPLSSKDIVYYLTYRTNHLTAWMVLLSVGTAIVLDVSGTEMFWERGLISLLFLLSTVELIFLITLHGYGNGKPEKVGFFEAEIPTARKVRVVIYTVYCFGMLMANMIVGMFMDFNEHAKTKLLVLLIGYLVMYIFRADAKRFVKFQEYSKMPGRGMYGGVYGGGYLGTDMKNQQV